MKDKNGNEFTDGCKIILNPGTRHEQIEKLLIKGDLFFWDDLELLTEAEVDNLKFWQIIKD